MPAGLVEQSGRILGWLLILAIAFVAVRGSLPKYEAILGF